MGEGIRGPILTFDPATRVGWACGRAGEHPQSGVVTLKKTGDPRGIAFDNLISWLQSKISDERPELIVKEAPMPLQAFRQVGSSEDNVRLQFGLHAILEAMAQRFGVNIEDVSASTVRKHFIGHAHMYGRAETKRAVVQRCHMLGLMPRECADDNIADALAIHDWACAVYGRRHHGSDNLVMFGEQPDASIL